jgi:hypothetical protein
VIAGYVFTAKPDYLFCFAYQSALNKTHGGKEKLFKPQIDGWNMYAPEREYARMGLPTADLAVSHVNQHFRLCSTYVPLSH